MRRRIALAALVVLAGSGPGCGAGIFDWKTQDEDFTATQTATTAPEDSSGTTAATPGTASTDTSTSDATSSDTLIEPTTTTTTTTTVTSTETTPLTDTTATSSETTSASTGPSCGDGECGPGEDFASCPDDCDPVCGNGEVEADEACDDGNADDTDACVQGCKAATCGDGFVRAGVEECDDMNQIDGDACSSACELPRRVVFVTKDVFQGNMRKMNGATPTGLIGADLQCNTSATAAGLVGPFRAWLSDGTANPAGTFDASVSGFAGIYVLADGATKVADGWADLVDGSLDHAIDMTEEKTGMQDVTPWSNTASDGTGLFQMTSCCDNWASNSGGKMGPIGYAVESVVNAEWTDFNKQACSGFAPLYCVEDHP